ncbi:MAG: PRC-barrel domain-containing protein [Candidatus Binatia bacterium]
MLMNVRELKNYKLDAKDGDIGSVEDFYFDDEGWTIRYLVANTGPWLVGRRVLISPISLGKLEPNKKIVEVALTKSQIEKSPDIDTHKPISRQHETAYYDYYGYPYYWYGPHLWGPIPYPGYIAPPSAQTGTVDSEIEAAKDRQRNEDQHLRSTQEVTNYYIEATDGEIGHVEDFIIEDQTWTIRYIVVDTKNWWPGKKVVISPQWIREVNWGDSKIYADVSRDAIRNAPEYRKGLDRGYETRLHEHHGRQVYWD